MLHKSSTHSDIPIIYAGTPDFSVPALKTLLDNQYNVIAVYTQPDRPSGRGQQLTASPVKKLALEHNIPVYQPNSLRDQVAQAEMAKLNPAIMIVAAYGLILPESTLHLPQYGCINIHASLLPRWRGAAPIQHAILAGDKVTGITLMQMDKGLDTGLMLSKKKYTLSSDETSQTLHDKLAQIGAELLIETLPDILNNKIEGIPQEEIKACYAAKINKTDAEINWKQSAEAIERTIRAYTHWPIAYTFIDNQPLRVWEAHVEKGKNTNEKPGSILNIHNNAIDVVTGDGIISLTKLQFPGGKPLTVKELLNSTKYEKLLKSITCF